LRRFRLRQRRHHAAIIDPKGVDYDKYRGATLIKPNVLEAGKVLNRDLPDAEAVRTAGLAMVERFGTSILITQGSAGMSLFQPNRPMTHIPAQAREVYDVTGAGDTVAGTMALTLAVGGNLDLACRLASSAAAVVVGKVGTATVSLEELQMNLIGEQRQAA
jgi:rfaE bifunctional protein kinase chain/domain